MSRRPALVTQAAINRAIRAAKQAGAASIEVRPDGVIVVQIAPPLAPVLDDDSQPVIL
jgi:hypothetical protein